MQLLTAYKRQHSTCIELHAVYHGLSLKNAQRSYWLPMIVMQVGRAISFIGSTLALALMTVISVLIGYGFKSVPDALKSSVPVGRYLSVACMVYFGVRTLQVSDSCDKYRSAESKE